MLARVLFTNGTKTVDLYWILHNGTDVYHGIPKLDQKSSYHQSGRVHIKENGETISGFQATPLAELKGKFQLCTASIPNVAGILADRTPFRIYSGKRADCVLTIDSRSFPNGQRMNVDYSLIEVGNLEALGQAVSNIEQEGFWLRPQQVLVATSVSPWVVVTLAITSG